VLGSDVSGRTAEGLLDLMIWTSEALLVAELSPEGVVRRANAALMDRVPSVVGQPIHAIVTPPHRAPLDAALHGATAGWSSLRIGMFPDERDVPAEHRVWVSGSPERILLVAEPDDVEEERVIDALLSLNDELVRARRADRALNRARRDVDHGRRLLAGWRALARPALARVEPRALVDHVLDTAAEAVAATMLMVVHAPGGSPTARVVAARGVDVPRVTRVPVPQTSAGRMAFGEVRLAEDRLTVRLLSPHIAEAGARRLAVVPLGASGAVALHAGWTESGPRGDEELALLEHAAAVMADAIAERLGAVAAPAGDVPAEPAEDEEEQAAELDVTRDEEAPRTVRHWLENELAAVLGDEARRTAVLLASELVTNAVRHSTAPGDVSVVARRLAGGLRVAVADPGGAPWSAQGHADRAGFGLALVDALSARWGIERAGRTTVWFELSG
jgi:anti-sigma regulatory factor (Ser/Thr protein kinase)